MNIVVQNQLHLVVENGSGVSTTPGKGINQSSVRYCNRHSMEEELNIPRISINECVRKM